MIRRKKKRTAEFLVSHVQLSVQIKKYVFQLGNYCRAGLVKLKK